MFSRFKQPRQPSSSFRAVTTPVSSIPADVQTIEAYLDAISAHLSDLPPLFREEIRRELEQHILSLIAAHEELGETHDQAVASALKQFGDSRKIARELVPKNNIVFSRAAFVDTLRWFSLSTILSIVVFVVLSFIEQSLHLPRNVAIKFISIDLVLYSGIFWIVLPALGARWVAKGRGKGATLGVFGAIVTLSVITFPIMSVLNFIRKWLHPNLDFLSYVVAYISFYQISLLLCLPAAMFSAWLTQHLNKRQPSTKGWRIAR